MIYYLVQGEAYQYPLRIAEMQGSGARVIFLTWDNKIEGALFLPNSTWAQGRNFLLQHILKNNYKFDYLVFIDGDAKPIKGSWQKFNNFLLEHKIQVCLPLMQVTQNFLHKQLKRLHLSFLIPEYQRALLLDNQVVAYRKDIINSIEKFIFPTIFDSVSWNFNCVLTQHILRYIIPYNIIQFNKLEVENNNHRLYQKSDNIKYLTSYINKLGIRSLLPFFQLKTANNINIGRLIVLLNSFIELFYLIPFPIKEFDVTKRANHLERRLAQIKENNIVDNKPQSCKSI